MCYRPMPSLQAWAEQIILTIQTKKRPLPGSSPSSRYIHCIDCRHGEVFIVHKLCWSYIWTKPNSQYSVCPGDPKGSVSIAVKNYLIFHRQIIALFLLPMEKNNNLEKTCCHFYRLPFWRGIMFSPASVCLSVCLFVCLSVCPSICNQHISQQWSLVQGEELI